MSGAKTATQDRDALLETLHRIDGRGYKAYKDIEGAYRFSDGLTLFVDHAQGDPFAAPSRCRVRVDAEAAGFRREDYAGASRERAARDFLARGFSVRARRHAVDRGSGGSGAIGMARPGQTILERSSVLLGDGGVEARFTVGLPAHGRRVLGRQAAQLLGEDVPALARKSLYRDALDAEAFRRHGETCEDADAIREQLRERGLVAFVANGAILPRRSGVDERPLDDAPVAFETPEALRVSFDRPNGGRIDGMGVPTGVTLVTGGGFHGKSTLLRAVELGVDNHIPGDGREWVVTDPAAVKIRAEDGRAVSGVNLAPFINDLPGGRSTEDFSTPNASGSTSQAANILEMLEAGSTALLIDEDTSATNFMIRDRRMQALVAREREPITPFVDKARQLRDELGVSTILVTGGSGDYLDIADTVITMEAFRPRERTDDAREIAERFATGREAQGGERFGPIANRCPRGGALPRGKRGGAPKIRTRAVDEIAFEKETVDLSAVEQVVETEQLEAIAGAIMHVDSRLADGRRDLASVLDAVEELWRERGLDAFAPVPVGYLAGFRRFELAAALNRLRTLRVAAG